MIDFPCFFFIEHHCSFVGVKIALFVALKLHRIDTIVLNDWIRLYCPLRRYGHFVESNDLIRSKDHHYLAIIWPHFTEEGLIRVLTETSIGAAKYHHVVAIDLNGSRESIQLEFGAQ